MSNERAPILRVANAAFERGGEILVEPFSLVLAAECARLEAPDALGASLRARMLAGIVKATSGTLSIGEFDPRIQPVQAKRLVGFVALSLASAGREGSLERATIDTHADLWEVDRESARAAAADVLARLGSSDPYARAIALALIRPVALLVLDRPPPALETTLVERLGLRSAIVSTSVASVAALPAARFAATVK